MKMIVVVAKSLANGPLFGGKPGELVSLWKNGLIGPLCSKEILKEYLRILAYSPEFIASIMQKYKQTP